MLITIRSVEVTTTPAKGKGRPYQTAQLSYTVNGETKAWKLMSFSNPAVFATLSKAEEGESFEITTGKNDQDYTVWTSAVKSDGGPAPGKTPMKLATGSTYETREERAAKQILIVRQSSLTAAIGTLGAGAKAPLHPEDVITVAERYASWVFETPDIDEDPFDQPNDI
jgi:hypothetical protein